MLSQNSQLNLLVYGRRFPKKMLGYYRGFCFVIPSKLSHWPSAVLERANQSSET